MNETPKETFRGRNSLDSNDGGGTGLERIVRQQIADQVATVLRNI